MEGWLTARGCASRCGLRPGEQGQGGVDVVRREKMAMEAVLTARKGWWSSVAREERGLWCLVAWIIGGTRGGWDPVVRARARPEEGSARGTPGEMVKVMRRG